MDAEICEAVQAMWKEIGVDVKLDFFEWAATFNQIRNPVNDYHVMHIGWVLPNPDADVYYYSLFHSSSMLPKGWNFCRFVNPEADKLLDEARSSYDQPKRLANYKRTRRSWHSSCRGFPSSTPRRCLCSRARSRALYQIHASTSCRWIRSG